jgi:hypothetical protein
MDRFFFQKLEKNCTDAVSWSVFHAQSWPLIFHKSHLLHNRIFIVVSSFECIIVHLCMALFKKFLEISILIVFKHPVLINRLYQKIVLEIYMCTLACAQLCAFYLLFIYRVNTFYSVQFTANSALHTV